MTPLMIEVALNGVTSKERNQHVPRTPQEVAADGLRCLGAGASIVHNHIDLVTTDGEAAAGRYLEAWRLIWEVRPDAIVYPTVGFGSSVQERYAHIPVLAACGHMRMSLWDTGSVNLGGVAANGLPGGAFDFVYVNTFSDILYVAEQCGTHRLAPSIAVFEPGFLRTVLAYRRAGRLPAGAFVKLYFGGDCDYLTGAPGGVSFGLPPTRQALEAYLAMLDGTEIPWAVAVIGGDVLESGLAREAVQRGGHVRVGLEDYAGRRTPSNEELVREVTQLATQLGRPIASCETAAELLGFPA